ncbi:DNA/RNA non-specific endonuclease [Leisingera aquaemixtae]|uniref:DNA/RNA non-specific endonuclease n=1 Tax=Leisingera aquaemixtae TaxID=1396826 RepID=UPI0039841D79
MEKFKSVRRSAVTFEGKRFSAGAQKVTCLLTTGCLTTAGSKPMPSACQIVDRWNTEWDVKDLFNINDIKKALSSKTTLKKIATERNAHKILELLGLYEIAMLTDYNELQAVNYIKGHLLNEYLGGPGTDDNLTPMTQSANSTYYHRFEKGLILALKAAKLAEVKSEYFVRVAFSAECSGALKPWWGDPTRETANMLKRLPRKVTASYELKGYYLSAKPGPRGLAFKALPPAEQKIFAKANGLFGTGAKSYTLDLFEY